MVNYYSESGLALSWAEKQKAVTCLRESSPSKKSPKGSVETSEGVSCHAFSPPLAQADKAIESPACVAETESATDPVNDCFHSKTALEPEDEISVYSFTESEAEEELTWEEWEERNKKEFVQIKRKPKTDMDERPVPQEVLDRMKAFHKDLNEFAAQPWLQQNSTNNFGEAKEVQDMKKKPAKLPQTVPVEKTSIPKRIDSSQSGLICSQSNDEVKLTEETCGEIVVIDGDETFDEPDTLHKVTDNDKLEVTEKQEDKQDTVSETTLDVVDLEEEEFSRPPCDDSPSSVAKMFDGEASLEGLSHQDDSDIKKNGERNQMTAVSDGSFSAHEIASRTPIKIKKMAAKADYESAFNMSWNEKQRAILQRREVCKPAVRLIDAKVQGGATFLEATVEDKVDDVNLEGSLSQHDDAARDLWKRSPSASRKTVSNEDHDNAFNLSWKEKEKAIVERRLY
jgi:hypothetical protein